MAASAGTPYCTALRVAAMASPIALPAARCDCGGTCEYTSAVTRMLECPSISETTFIGTPAASPTDAAP